MMNTTKIYLIRHAEPTARDIDRPLSEIGQRQAAKVAENLRDSGISLIYASPLKRARETAEFVANVCKSEIVERPGLEELNWEVWHKEGEKWDFVTAQEHLEDLPLFEEQNAFLRIAQDRAQDQINAIYKENVGRTVAVISHGNVIRSFLTGIMGAHVIGFLSLDIALTGVSLIEMNDRGRYKILFINNSDHLFPAPLA